MIDWEAVYGSGWIRRYAAAPAFEGSSSLLDGAALLWRGRYGEGRVVGGKAHDLASQMNDLGSHWREAATRWTANLLFDESGGVAYALDRFRLERHYRKKDDIEVVKHPQAARRLVQAALTMASDRIETIRSSREREDHGHDAKLWENRFEELGETSLGIPPNPPLDDAQREALERFCVFRACENLCAITHAFLYTRGDWLKRDGKNKPKEERLWESQCDLFKDRARDAYARFVDACPKDEAEALRTASDDSYASADHPRYNSPSAEESAKVMALLALVVSFTLRTLGDKTHAEWDAQMLGNALKAAKIDMKKLGPGLKALPERTSR